MKCISIWHESVGWHLRSCGILRMTSLQLHLTCRLDMHGFQMAFDMTYSLIQYFALPCYVLRSYVQFDSMYTRRCTRWKCSFRPLTHIYIWMIDIIKCLHDRTSHKEYKQYDWLQYEWGIFVANLWALNSFILTVCKDFITTFAFVIIIQVYSAILRFEAINLVAPINRNCASVMI